MKITPPITPLIDPVKQDIASLLQRLQPGQQLQAQVLESPKQALVKLQIGVMQLLAKTPIKLDEGVKLQLEVTKLAPLPELKIRQLQLPPPEQNTQLLLKAALPRQIPPMETAQQLKQIITQHGDKLPPQVKEAVQTLVTRGINPEKPDAQLIRQEFKTSGLFTEPLLKQGQTPPVTDQKIQLLSLLSLLKPELLSVKAQQLLGMPGTPGIPGVIAPEAQQAGGRPNMPTGLLDQLFRLLEGAVARIQTHQAASMPQEEGVRQVWQFELPVVFLKEQEYIPVRFEKEYRDNKDRKNETRWTVTLDFDFETTGPFQVRIQLQGEKVSANFYCQRPDATRMISNRLDWLSTSLEKAGLEVGQLTSTQGNPLGPGIKPQDSSLLDERV